MLFNRALFILLVFSTRVMAAASESRSTTLLVSVKPEAALYTLGLSSVGLKIRLSVGASARLWLAETCSSAPVSAYVIQTSGEYQIPVSSIGTEGRVICLSSTDGL